MKKLSVLGIIIAVYFISLPLMVFACGTGEISTPPECVEGVISFQALPNEFPTATAAMQSQLFVEVNPLIGNKVKFHFINTGDVASTITAVYFADDSPLLFNYAGINPATDIIGSTGVAFTPPASAVLPPGELPSYFPTIQFSANADFPLGGATGNGINPGEWLDILLGFEAGADYTTFKNAIADGSMSLGLHVQSIGDGDSIKMISNLCNLPTGALTPVPEPATMLLLGTGLVGIAGTVRRRKKLIK